LKKRGTAVFGRVGELKTDYVVEKELFFEAEKKTNKEVEGSVTVRFLFSRRNEHKKKDNKHTYFYQDHWSELSTGILPKRCKRAKI